MECRTAARSAAYAQAWVDDTEEDASIAVADAAAASREIAHVGRWDVLEGAGGVKPPASTQSVIAHDGDDDSSFDTDRDLFATIRDG